MKAERDDELVLLIGGVARIRDLVARTPDAMATAVNAEPVRALRSDLPTRLLDRVSARTRQCRQALDR